MSTLILRSMGRLLAALLILFSVYMLLRGHNQPGGGFIGGLIATLGIVVGSLGEGTRRARRALRTAPRIIAVGGLAVALAAGFAAAFAGKPFLTGLWTKVAGMTLGTPILFDVGVYLVVVGATLAVLLALEEDAGSVDAGGGEEDE